MSVSITLTFPDGSSRSYESGVTGLEVATSISEGLARVAVAIGVDGETRDLARSIDGDATIQIYTLRDNEGWATYWHSSAHLMAEALQELHPGVKFGIGPAIDKGFYYDVDLGDRQLTADDLEAIEKKMMELAKRNVTFERREVPKEEAIAYFKEKGDEYKLELLKDLEDGTITFYTQGEFTDLCRGPHVPSSKSIKYAKLLNIAGAYWRGDQERKQLTRLYGITFPKKGELDDFLEKLELAKQRDHRKLGKELELFHFSQKVGSGLPLWLPKGHHAPGNHDEFPQGGAAASWISAGDHPSYRAFGTIQNKRSLPVLLGQSVPTDDGRRGGRLSPQADELPAPYPDLRCKASFLPRPPGSTGGIRDGVSL